MGMSDIASRAKAFATAAHGEQKYKGLPYVDEHVAAVVRVLEDFGFGPEYLAAGWLHDVLEDTAVGFAELERAFGSEISRMVWACTGVWANRKARNACIAARLESVPHAAPVKVADRIANIEASEDGSSHRTMYLKEMTGFCAVVADHAPPAMMERLHQA